MVCFLFPQSLRDKMVQVRYPPVNETDLLVSFRPESLSSACLHITPQSKAATFLVADGDCRSNIPG
jgi:hypothetical protein